MKFKRRIHFTPAIPSASMSDIVFSLLLFFMISTVIKSHDGLAVRTPEAENIEKLSSKTHTSYLWIDKAGKILFDDTKINSMDELYTIARTKIEKDNRLLVFLRADQDLSMGVISDVQEQLRRAGALRIFFAAETKERTEPGDAN